MTEDRRSECTGTVTEGSRASVSAAGKPRRSESTASAQAGSRAGARAGATKRFYHDVDSEAGTSAEFNLMLRGLLHELRNPLSSILTAASLVEDTGSKSSEISEETSMLLGVIKKESLRLNRILTEFSNFIKLPEPRPTEFDFALLTRDVVAQLQNDGVLSPGVQVSDGLPESCFVWADQSQMRTALHHLLRNAGEAMPEDGILQLRFKESGDKVVLSISDSGVGWSKESRERAFQPFYSTKLHGIGLGLSAVRAILAAARGRVWLAAGDEVNNEVNDEAGNEDENVSDANPSAENVASASDLQSTSTSATATEAGGFQQQDLVRLRICIELPLAGSVPSTLKS